MRRHRRIEGGPVTLSIPLRVFDTKLHEEVVKRIRGFATVALLQNNQTVYRQNTANLFRYLAKVHSTLPPFVYPGFEKIEALNTPFQRTKVPVTRKAFAQAVEEFLPPGLDLTESNLLSDAIVDSTLFHLDTFKPELPSDKLLEFVEKNLIDCDTIYRGFPLVFIMIERKKIDHLEKLIELGANTTARCFSPDQKEQYSLIDYALLLTVKESGTEEFEKCFTILKRLWELNVRNFYNKGLFEWFKGEVISPDNDFEAMIKLLNFLRQSLPPEAVEAAGL